MTQNFLLFFWLFWSIFLTIEGHVFDCLGKCKCYPEQKIIQCPTGLRNQLGLTSKADIEGFTVNDLKKPENPDFKEFKVIPEGTFKPTTTRAPRSKYGKSRPRRNVEAAGRDQALGMDKAPGRDQALVRDKSPGREKSPGRNKVPKREKRVVEDDVVHRFKMWLIDFRRQIQNMSRRH